MQLAGDSYVAVTEFGEKVKAKVLLMLRQCNAAWQ
jgi:hypothetical protein